MSERCNRSASQLGEGRERVREGEASQGIDRDRRRVRRGEGGGYDRVRKAAADR